MAPLPAPLDRFHWRQAWAAAKQHPVGSPRRTSCWLGRCLCTRVAFPVSHLSCSSSLIAGWCYCFVCPPLALYLPFSRLFLYPIGISSFIGTGRVRDKKEQGQTRERTAGASSSVYAARWRCKVHRSSDRTTLSNDKTIIVPRSSKLFLSPCPYVLNTFRNVTYSDIPC